MSEDYRKLTQAEKRLAQSVFDRFLPYDDISIGNHTGIGGAPWTKYSVIYDYTIHFGPSGYADATSTAVMRGFGVIRNIFIHELTHVWQGYHSHFSGSYMIQSGFAQLASIVRTGDRDGAYNYTPGQDWDSYNVEQQANIVEDWFKNGASTSHSLFPYIRDNIRR